MCQLNPSFDFLIESEWSALVNLLVGRGVPSADAPDLVQEALLRTFVACEGDPCLGERLLASRAAFRAFVVKTALNLFRDCVRTSEHKNTTRLCELEQEDQPDAIERVTVDRTARSPLAAVIDAEQAVQAAPALGGFYSELADSRTEAVRNFVCIFQEVEGYFHDVPALRLLRLGAYIYNLTDYRPLISNRILDRQVGAGAPKDTRNKQRKANDGVCRKLKERFDHFFLQQFGRIPEGGRMPYTKKKPDVRNLAHPVTTTARNLCLPPVPLPELSSRFDSPVL